MLTFESMPERIDEWIARARKKWPEIDVKPSAFAAHVARFEAYHRERSSGQSSPRIHGDDLYLAFACLERNEHALNALRALCKTEAMNAFRKAKVPAADADDLLQDYFSSLVLAQAGAEPQIAKYAGSGPLTAWLRISAMRKALERARGEKPSEALDEQTFSELVETEPEIDWIRAHHREDFEAAFRDALQSLAEHDRTLLRHHLLSGWTLMTIAEHLGVSHATVARRLTVARERFGSALRTLLSQRLNLATSELESLVRLFESHLEALCSQILLPTAQSAF